MPSIIGLLVIAVGLTMIYLGIHGATFLPIYPKGATTLTNATSTPLPAQV